MEERGFDELTRRLGAATSRRQVLKGLLGAFVGTLLASLGVKSPPLAFAASTCDAGQIHQCEDQARIGFQASLNNCKKLRGMRGEGPAGMALCQAAAAWAFHEALQRCRNKHGCRGNQTCCHGQCVDTNRDEQNCGACDHACPDGAVCRGGHCHCRRDQVQCANGQCHDAHCPANKTLDPDLCTCVCRKLLDCPPGQSQDPVTCQCVPTCEGKSDGTPCGAGDGQCCSGQCVELDSNHENCGACGNACSDCQECIGGTCQDTCGSECLKCQDGLCVDNCGPCLTCDTGSGTCIAVSCPVCQSCDPAGSGVCEAVTNGTPCPDGKCQDGQCQPEQTCTEPKLPCSNGDCCDNSTDWGCCGDGCCGVRQTASGPGVACTGPDFHCCPPGTEVVMVGCQVDSDYCQPFSVVIDGQTYAPSSCGAEAMSEWSSFHPCSQYCVVEVLG